MLEVIVEVGERYVYMRNIEVRLLYFLNIFF